MPNTNVIFNGKEVKMETMYKCSCCDEIFEEHQIKVVKTTYENYYGIPLEQYQISRSLEISTCPFCDSEEIKEYEEEEDE